MTTFLISMVYLAFPTPPKLMERESNLGYFSLERRCSKHICTILLVLHVLKTCSTRVGKYSLVVECLHCMQHWGDGGRRGRSSKTFSTIY